jgi:uncharacterized protein (DUF427 family)
MPRAIWNGTVIAETDRHELVEGNVYFPPESVKREFLQPSDNIKGHVAFWRGVTVER